MEERRSPARSPRASRLAVAVPDAVAGFRKAPPVARPDPFGKDHGPFAEAMSCSATSGFVVALERFRAQPDPIRVENAALRVCRHLGTPLGFCRRTKSRRWLSDSIAPGQHFVFGAGATADFAWNDDFETLSVTVAPAALESLHAASGAEAGAAASGVEVVWDDPLLERLSGALLLDARQGFARGAVFLEGLCFALASHLLHAASGAAKAVPGLSEGELRRVRALVEERLSERLTLADLAGAVGLPSHRLSRGFRRTTGQPLWRYLLERRVAHTEALLNDHTLPLASVAVLAGFSSQAHMTTVFRLTKGVTPGAWRRGARG
jgi:AraC-like DNA-binding protein